MTFRLSYSTYPEYSTLELEVEPASHDETIEARDVFVTALAEVRKPQRERLMASGEVEIGAGAMFEPRPGGVVRGDGP